MPYRFLVHGGFCEVELFGVLDRLEPLTKEEWELVVAMRAVLYNYTEVEKATFDPYAMAEATKRMADRGIRFAAVASQPAWFGLSRQVAQISEAPGDRIHVFQDRPSAVAWLLHGSLTPD